MVNMLPEHFSKICSLLMEHRMLCESVGDSKSALRYSQVLQLKKDIADFSKNLQIYRQKVIENESQILSEIDVIIADLVKGV